MFLLVVSPVKLGCVLLLAKSATTRSLFLGARVLLHQLLSPQCQMAKQTMGTPLQALTHRTDTKLYRLQVRRKYRSSDTLV